MLFGELFVIMSGLGKGGEGKYLYSLTVSCSGLAPTLSEQGEGSEDFGHREELEGCCCCAPEALGAR